MCLAIPGKITELDDERPYATVDVAQVQRRVNVDLLRDNPLDVGDWVLIHVGFAMSKISEEQANEQMELLNMLGEDEEAREEVEGYRFDDRTMPAPSPASTTARAPNDVPAVVAESIAASSSTSSHATASDSDSVSDSDAAEP